MEGETLEVLKKKKNEIVVKVVKIIVMNMRDQNIGIIWGIKEY